MARTRSGNLQTRKWKLTSDFSLTYFLISAFFLSAAGQVYFGFNSYKSELIQKGLPPVNSLSEYLQSGHFISSLFENMESEFLQMALFVYLTIFLYQRGSSESKPPPDEKDKPKVKLRTPRFSKQPILRKIYENSLTLALVLMFLVSFYFHAVGSVELINTDRMNQNLPVLTWWQVFSEDEFWFQSFQNWQSEFFSIALLGLLSIFLRQKDSPQSKEVDAPHWQTGGSGS